MPERDVSQADTQAVGDPWLTKLHFQADIDLLMAAWDVHSRHGYSFETGRRWFSGHTVSSSPTIIDVALFITVFFNALSTYVIYWRG